MWGTDIKQNIQRGIPQELITNYPLLFKNNCIPLRYTANCDPIKHLGEYVPAHLNMVRTSIENYVSLLTYPIVRSNILINIWTREYSEVTLDIKLNELNDTEYNLIVEYDADVRFDQIPEKYKQNEGLTKLLQCAVYTDDEHTVIVLSDEYDILQLNWNKIISCFYYFISQEKELKFDKMYDALFNNKITKWNKEYLEWLDSWYPEAAKEEEKEILKQAIVELLNNKTRALNSSITTTTQNIEYHENILRDLYRDLEHYRMTLIGAQSRNTDEIINKIFNIFERCDNLLNVSITTDRSITLHFRAPLLNYDLDLAERWCNNDNNVFYNAGMQDLMYKLLVSEKYTLLLESYISWNAESCRVCADNMVTLDRYKYCPQPHIVYYNCFGDNKIQIEKALATGDLSLALDCTNAAISSVNLTDGPVINRLIMWLSDHISNNTVKCVMNNETGEMVSIMEVNEDDSIHR